MLIEGGLFAQPAQGMGSSLVMLDKFHGIVVHITHISIMQIRYRDPAYPKAKDRLPKWSECLNDSTQAFKDLYLYSAPFLGCGHRTIHSEVSNRFYLFGYSPFDPVLIIESGKKRMYIVLPNISSNPLYSLFLDEAKKNASADHKISETIYLNLSGIKFEEGVFFVKEYFSSENLANNPLNQSLQEDYSILHDSMSTFKDDHLTFFQPFEKELAYSKKLKGGFSESKVIDLIIKNSSSYAKKIMDYAYWEKYINSNSATSADLELAEFLDNLKKTEEEQLTELFQSYKNRKISREQLISQYELIQKQQFSFILANNFDLALAFCKYLKKDKTDDVLEFVALFEKQTFAISKAELESFLKENK
jgi:hypothetical protein